MTVATSMKESVPSALNLPSLVWALNETPKSQDHVRKVEGPRISRTVTVWLAGLLVGTIFVAGLYGFSRLGSVFYPETEDEPIPCDSNGGNCESEMCLKYCYRDMYTVCPCGADCLCPTRQWWLTVVRETVRDDQCSVICQTHQPAFIVNSFCHEVNTNLCSNRLF